MKRTMLRALGIAFLWALTTAAFAAPSGNPVVEMTVSNRGKVTIELYPKEAPKTVAHFQQRLQITQVRLFLFHRFFGQARTVGSVERAMVVLGVAMVRNWRNWRLAYSSKNAAHDVRVGDREMQNQIPMDNPPRVVSDDFDKVYFEGSRLLDAVESSLMMLAVLALIVVVTAVINARARS